MMKNRKRWCKGQGSKKCVGREQGKQGQGQGRRLPGPRKAVPKVLNKGSTNNSFANHFASTTEVMYSSFDRHCYLPPHLSSFQIKQALFHQPAFAKVSHSSCRKYDYDALYNAHQARYWIPTAPAWKAVPSKIKSLLDQDRLTYSHFHSPKHPKVPRQRECHPDDDLSEDSEEPQQQQ